MDVWMDGWVDGEHLPPTLSLYIFHLTPTPLVPASPRLFAPPFRENLPKVAMISFSWLVSRRKCFYFGLLLLDSLKRILCCYFWMLAN